MKVTVRANKGFYTQSFDLACPTRVVACLAPDPEPELRLVQLGMPGGPFFTVRFKHR